uniref:Putative thioesterase n=1 Tax=Stutzerimonas stutzeri TaxID=316 RepID=Q9L8R2_STUST|nr:putative thioesterase [Stutzerimonas stutzeri]
MNSSAACRTIAASSRPWCVARWWTVMASPSTASSSCSRPAFTRRPAAKSSARRCASSISPRNWTCCNETRCPFSPGAVAGRCGGTSEPGLFPLRRRQRARVFSRGKRPPKAFASCMPSNCPAAARRLREPFAESLAQLAEAFAEQCRALPNKPLILFGHSLGALLAYETARVLLAKGERPPVQLLVSSRQSPDWLPACAGLPALNDQALRDYLGNLAGTPPEVLQSKAMMDLAVPVLQADLKLILNYQHRHLQPLSIPVLVFGAISDQQVRYESLLSWERISGEGFSLRMIEGGHFAVMQQPQWVLDQVQTEL